MKTKLMAVVLIGLAGQQLRAQGFLNVGTGNTVAAGSSCAALGGDNIIVESAYSLAAGYGNNITHDLSSLLAGAYNGIYGAGESNIMLGHGNYTDGLYDGFNVLIGSTNASHGATNGWAIGLGNIAQSQTLTLGTYAQPVADAALIVGKGSSDINRSNGLVVLKNGDVSIPGTLSVGGAGVITSTSAASVLAGQGFLSTANATSYLTGLGFMTTAGLGNSFKNVPNLAIGGTNTASGPSSFATGAWTIASAPAATAIGYLTVASGYTSIAMGNYANASGNYAMAAGTLTNAVGESSFAAGRATWARGEASFAAGYYSQANGTKSFAAGHDCRANGSMSFATGFANTAADQAAALGYLTCANGQASFTAGACTQANKWAAVALGDSTIANSVGETVLGMYNNPYPAYYMSGWNPVEAVLEVGNGAHAADRSNAITTLKNGRTTLTNKEWKADNAVAPSASNANGEALVVEGHTRLCGNVIIEQAQGDISMGIYGQ